MGILDKRADVAGAVASVEASRQLNREASLRAGGAAHLPCAAVRRA